jgi:hypothetical protein
MSTLLESGCRRKRNNLELRRIAFAVRPIVLKEKERLQRLCERIHQRCFVAFDLWHTAKTPKDSREPLHEFCSEHRLRIMLSHQLRAELVKIIGVLTDNDEHLCRQGSLREFRRDRSLPAWLRGPVLFVAFARLACSCLFDVIIGTTSTCCRASRYSTVLHVHQ